MKSSFFSKTEIIMNSIILGIVASISHFAYDFSGNNKFIGLFNPINESVWEHLKFMFFPLLVWWMLVYTVKQKQCNVEREKFIISAATSLVLSPVSVMMLFYTYTGIFGKGFLIVDISLVFVCCFFVLIAANHLLIYLQPSKTGAVLSIIIVAVVFTMFMIFTLNPPQLHLFQI